MCSYSVISRHRLSWRQAEASKHLRQHMYKYINMYIYRERAGCRGRTIGTIPLATLRTTLLVTGRLWESRTVECYFSPPLSVASSLGILHLTCLAHSSWGTRYLLAERSLVLQGPRKGSLVCVCHKHA